MIPEPTERTTETLRKHVRLLCLGLVCLAVATAVTGTVATGRSAAATTHGTPGSVHRSSDLRNAADAQTATQAQAPLIVTDSVVISGDTALAPGQSDCGVTNQFYHGQKAVFRIKVIDPQTGRAMNDSQLSGVAVHITSGNGQTLNASYGTHGPDEFWATAWTIPDSFPAGQVNYTISVTGQNAQTVTFAVPPSELTVLNKSVDDIKNGQSGGGQGQSSPSLPIVFWVVVLVVAVVVVGLVWNAERQ